MQDPYSCPSYFFQSDYKLYLRRRRLIAAAPDTTDVSSRCAAQIQADPGSPLDSPNQIQDCMKCIDELKLRVDRLGKAGLSLTVLVSTGLVILFLVSSTIAMLAVLIYLVAAH